MTSNQFSEKDRLLLNYLHEELTHTQTDKSGKYSYLQKLGIFVGMLGADIDVSDLMIKNVVARLHELRNLQIAYANSLEHARSIAEEDVRTLDDIADKITDAFEVSDGVKKFNPVRDIPLGYTGDGQKKSTDNISADNESVDKVKQ